MVFIDQDRQVSSAVCTIANLVGNVAKHHKSIIVVAQYMGMPKDETQLLLADWDEMDVIEFNGVEQKIDFVRSCFSYLYVQETSEKEEIQLYNKVIKNLGISHLSLN